MQCVVAIFVNNINEALFVNTRHEYPTVRVRALSAVIIIVVESETSMNATSAPSLYFENNQTQN